MTNSEWGAICCVYGNEVEGRVVVADAGRKLLDIGRGDDFGAVVARLPKLVRTTLDAMLSMAASCGVCGYVRKK